MNSEECARLLLAARQGGPDVPWRECLPENPAQAYAVQDATLAQLGGPAGWKVGARGPQQEPICAPLPAACLKGSGATLAGPAWRMRGIEVELALRVGRDLDVGEALLDPVALFNCFDAVLPAIEVVETRLADWRESDALAQLADLQSHGALVLGAPCAMPPEPLDLRTLEVCLTFDDHAVASTRGGNSAADLWRLLDWLVRHCARRGLPLRAGQIVTTGSCTGMLFAPEGARVRAQLNGIGLVGLQFAGSAHF